MWRIALTRAYWLGRRSADGDPFWHRDGAYRAYLAVVEALAQDYLRHSRLLLADSQS